MLVLITCSDCKAETPDTEGNTRYALDVIYELCDRCVTDWDTNGIPAHIAADLLG